MTRRKPHEPGRQVHTSAHICGYDGGDNDAPACGKPATLHVFPATETGELADWILQACPEHEAAAKVIAYDWHGIGPECGTPGALWKFGEHQGEGFCFDPDTAEAIAHELQTLSLEATRA